MPAFQNHPAITAYHNKLAALKAGGYVTETQTRAAFRGMLEKICEERALIFVEEIPVGQGNRKRIDGAVRDGTSSLGYWEAKDEKDDLDTEIKRKIQAGYPLSNTIFEDTRQAVLWQNFKEVERFDLTRGEEIAALLARFFGHTEADRESFETAVRDFVLRIPQLARELLHLIDEQQSGEKPNAKFQQAFGRFFVTCQTALNPQIKESTVKEMLVQHLLTERLFRVVFQNSEWVARNVIAQEIETVIAALASRAWSRAEFLDRLDPFYKVIEARACGLVYSEKQGFLNNVYERFFQGYSTETADTMGIVYTPQEIVDWMGASVERVLQTEFGQSLQTPGVKILDPCTGTGNFIVNILGRIPNVSLPQKYREDLFANEIMLLPYYVASGNIEHEYFDRLGEYQPFEGLCFADTLDLFQSAQVSMFAEENTARVAREKEAAITVIIGNPPYNVGQKNENDNNKNRLYKKLDDAIRQTYAKASKATLQNKLYDPYVRFFKWASERLNGEKGIVCFVSNNSFLDDFTFDGMRKHLGDEFNHIWHLDLHGNVRKNPKLSGTTHNVFGIQVGVGITILVRNKASKERFIRYHRVPETWRKTEKLHWLAEAVDVDGVAWQELTPNSKNAWLTEGLEADFETLVPLGTKAAKASFSAESKTVFKSYSLGISTNRDDWVYNFNREVLAVAMQGFVDFFNGETQRWKVHKDKKDNFDNFVDYDDKHIKWSSTLKVAAKGGKQAEFLNANIQTALYRPFCKVALYYDEVLIDRPSAFKRLIPLDKPNRMICVSNPANNKPFQCLMTDCIPDLHLTGDSQCFPLYTYSTDGSARFDNITSYALDAARRLYGADVTREDLFYATYATLHHPAYRLKYAENLKRELPRIPLDIWGAGLAPSSNQGAAGTVSPAGAAEINHTAGANRLEEGASPALLWPKLVAIGRALGDLHVGYESATPFSFAITDTTPEGKTFSFHIEKMRFNADKTSLRVNDSMTLTGFTPEMFAYKLGNRSALDWVVECYRVKRDERSGLVSDPNRRAAPRFILDLIGQVATVSLETQRLVGALPEVVA